MKATTLLLFALALGGVTWVSATVSIEFQLGGVNVPDGSIGVLVADTAGNGIESPPGFVGVRLEAGESFGDDVVLMVVSERDLPEWGELRGFADHFAVLDYSALGVAEGQALALHVFPDRREGDPVREGEPFLTYRSEDLGDLSPNSTMGFTLPRDGEAHLLAVIGQPNGGEADLGGVDLSALAYSAGSGSFDRELSPTSQHTYFLELATAGFLRLSGAPVAGLRAELRGPDGSILATSEGEIDFDEELEAGFHTLAVYLEEGAVGTASYAFQYSDTDIRAVVADVAVGPRPTALRGVGVVGGARGQLASIVSRQARRAVGYAAVSNGGERADRLVVRGSRSSRFSSIAYFAPANQTAAFVAGTFRTPIDLVAGDAALRIRVQFTPNRRQVVRRVGRRSIVQRRSIPAVVQVRPAVFSAPADAATLQLLLR